jgi:hypothetical protein
MLPNVIQCLTYFLISHTTLLMCVPVSSADQIPTRLAPRSNITSGWGIKLT